MGCNCTKKQGTQSYIYTDPKGRQTVYRTEVEARAAQIRQGGGSIQNS